FENGTCIKEGHVPISVPAIIVKKNQVLLTVSTLDLSFITENHLSNLFGVFADKQIKINMMQLSASSYSVCFDNDERRVPKLIAVLESQFKLKYNTGLELLTVRHFNNIIITELTSGKT